MKKNMVQNMVIAQSGGPSMVINASLVGAVLEARKNAAGRIGKILGARHGIDGIFNRDYVDLRKVSEAKLMKIADTPSSALGSVRKKPTADDCRRIFEEFVLAPKPDMRIGSCTATYRTRYGVVKSAWRYGEDGRLEWSFTVPPSTRAKVFPPDGKPSEYGPGDYTLR